MSTYSRITRHPLTAEYSIAEWRDDYFGPHRYGVKFAGDDVVYPADQVNNAQLKEFWVQDVLQTLRDMGHTEDQIILFLRQLQKVYKARWKRDPIGGEGAVENERQKREFEE